MTKQEETDDDDMSSLSTILANSTFDASKFRPPHGRELKAILFHEWQSCVPTASMSKTDDWFERLYQMHLQEGRYYHTPVHLWEMLQGLRVVFPTIVDTRPIKLAIFFHDAIYQPKSSTNELDSANLFEEFWAQHGDNPETGTLVRTMILATQTHQPVTNANANTNTSSLGILLDLDLLVLAKDWSDAYTAYAHAIRQEYQHVPLADYCRLRADLLQTHFLSADKQIYQTEFFQHHLQDIARFNLQKEIDLLKEGIIPFVGS